MKFDILNAMVKDLVLKEGFRVYSHSGRCLFKVKDLPEDENFNYMFYLLEREYKKRKKNPTKYGVLIREEIDEGTLQRKIKVACDEYRKTLNEQKKNDGQKKES